VADEKERLLKLELQSEYQVKEFTELRSIIAPITREHEELKTDIIKFLNKVENTQRDQKDMEDSVKEIEKTLKEYAGSFKFLENARKNMNTIFVAITIQAIFFIRRISTLDRCFK